jgi:predicted Zn finger-like uncharacterized protein
MAVEFRCPECRAKLRLADAPEPGEEVECPKCSHVFPAPDDGIEFRTAKKSRPADDGAKKKPARDEGDEPPQKKPPQKAPSEKPPAAPRKRRVKKKEVNKTLLYSVVGGGVVVVGAIIALLVWYFNRVPVANQMLGYLPEDVTVASGVNVGHIQKYPEFNKTIQQATGDKTFWKAGDALNKATGADLDYAVYGSGPSGFVWVLRSKKEFDPDALKKLPGARSYSADGVTYYTADDPGGFGGQVKAFAPNNRIAVFAQASIPDHHFRNMLKANTANPDKTILGRTAPLARRITRGTWWVISDTRVPAPPRDANAPGAGQEAERSDLQRVLADESSKGKAWGFKASAGSKAIRFEVALWCRDSDTASELSKKWKESELAKGDEGTPPRWWKSGVGTRAGDGKVQTELLASLGFTRDGELFVVRSEVETKTLMNSVSTLITNVSGVDLATLGQAPKQ